MKILSSNKGFSLIILVIAMTLVAILGTSFVSLVGMKQRGFLHQNDSYRALNIANAGTEYAIRYISDNLRVATSQYFQTPSSFQTSTSPVTIDMSNGSFSYWYDYGNDALRITGTYKNSVRQVRLNNFRRYVDSLTLRYDSAPLSVRRPSYGSGSIVIPIVNNNNLNINVSGIDISMPVNGRYLQRMYFTETSEIRVYNYADDTSYQNCASNPTLPCKDTTDWWDFSKTGMRIPSSVTVFTFTEHTPHSIPGNTISSFRILFDLPDTFSGTYSVLFKYTIGSETTPRTTLITFAI